MSEKKPVDQQIVDFLKKEGTATVDEVAAAVKIGRTSARKYLAGLTVDKKLVRAPGGREGRRKLPDNFSLPEKGRGGEPKKTASSGSKGGRLGPGGLDTLVLGHLRQHKEDSPQTASAIGKAIERSSGAVATAWRGWRNRERCGWQSRSRAPTSWQRRRRNDQLASEVTISRGSGCLRRTGRRGHKMVPSGS